MTTKELKAPPTRLAEDDIESLLLLLRHRETQRLVTEQRLLDQRDAARADAKEMAKTMPVVITDDAAPAPGHVFTRMSDDELRLAISRIKDESVKDGDTTRLRLAESVLNDRALERQRKMLKAGAESMTAFQR